MKRVYLRAQKTACPFCGRPAKAYVADDAHAYLKCDWKDCPNDAHPTSATFLRLITEDLRKDGLELVTEDEYFESPDCGACVRNETAEARVPARLASGEG